MEYRIAALQFAPIRGGYHENVEQMKALMTGISPEIDLLVLPELAASGYFFTDREELYEVAEEVGQGEFTRFLADWSRANQTTVVAGFAERSGKDIYNSACIVAPDGIQSVYRKTHLFYKESLVFTPGDSGFSVVTINGVNIGTMICYDWRFPESARTLCLAGADIIAHPSNLVAAVALWSPTMQTRSFENRLFTVTANRFGTERLGDEELQFTGESQIVDVNGTILTKCGANETALLSATIDLTRARRKTINDINDIIVDRRPEYYRC